MAAIPIALLRLQQLHISRPAVSPAKALASLVAVQAQDYAAFKWATGLRAPGATDVTIEAALNNASIVRTWALRNTLHTLAAADVHWVLDLVRERLFAKYASYYRQQSLDEKTLRKSQQVLQRTLAGGKQLTREELAAALENNGISLGDMRLNFILVRASLDNVICQGPRRGKEFTFTLLHEWITPPAQTLDYEEALSRLTLRYFTGHGPATSKDFAWWAGITGTEAKRGLDIVENQLERFTQDGQTYYMQPGIILDKDKANGIFLLPGFDEYLLGYADRSAALDDVSFRKIVYTGNGIFLPTIVINGRITGTLKRTFKKEDVHITLQPFAPLSKARLAAITTEARRYAKFMECKPVLPLVSL